MRIENSEQLAEGLSACWKLQVAFIPSLPVHRDSPPSPPFKSGRNCSKLKSNSPYL